MVVKKKSKKEDKKKANKSGEDEDDEEVVQEKDFNISEEEIQKKVKLLKKMIENQPLESRNIVVKGKKPITQIKKGDKMKIDGKEYFIISESNILAIYE